MTDARSKLDLLYQEVLGEVAEVVTRVEALQSGIPEATAALESAAGAAGEVKDAVAQVPEVILKQTALAGAELRGQVLQAGTQVGAAITGAISKAANSGADALRQAARDLPAAARARQAAIIDEWQSLLGQAAKAEARGRLAGRVARSFGAVAVVIMLSALIGATGALLGAQHERRLATGEGQVWSVPGGEEIMMRGQVYRMQCPPGSPAGAVCFVGD